MISPTRREFLAATAATAIALAAGRSHAESASPTDGTYPKLPKAMILTSVVETELKKLKDAGFDGCEAKGVVTREQAAESRKIADKLGLRIHSVLRGWADYNIPAKVNESLATSEACLMAAHSYGATTMLMVPCKVRDLPMPEPWEFKIEFDEKTGHVTKVAEGDNEKYRKYIDAQNYATDVCREQIRKLIPIAEREKVIIILEDVWNNLWVEPNLFKHFVSSFQSEWIQVHFDIGNIVKYSPPQQWIRTLGPLIKKCHVKDYKFEPGGHGGKMIHPRDGDVNWPEVRMALNDIGYTSWLTIEDRGLPLEEFNRRLDLIVAGK
jgi:hexulose-6-phosphate isomerase